MPHREPTYPLVLAEGDEHLLVALAAAEADQVKAWHLGASKLGEAAVDLLGGAERFVEIAVIERGSPLHLFRRAEAKRRRQQFDDELFKRAVLLFGAAR